MAGTLGRLYTGTGAFDVVGRRRIWYSISGLLVVVCLASIVAAASKASVAGGPPSIAAGPAFGFVPSRNANHGGGHGRVSLLQWHNSDLLAFVVDQPDLGGPDQVIDSGLGFCWFTVESRSSTWRVNT